MRAADTVEASLNLNNPFGYTDQVSIGVEHGTKHTNVYSVTYTLPKPLGRPVIADVRLHQLFSDREPWSSYVERLRGLIATIARSVNPKLSSLFCDFSFYRVLIKRNSL